MTTITILRCGPLTTLQDAGRFGMLRHGISASGPMDRRAFEQAGMLLTRAGATAIEYTQGLEIEVDGLVDVAWSETRTLGVGERLTIPAAVGNYGYLRFSQEVDLPALLGSRSTNVTVGLGGYKGRALKAGDRIALGAEGEPVVHPATVHRDGPIRVLWGRHADLFDGTVRQRFADAPFQVTTSLDRMGVKLADPLGVFAGLHHLSLVSDAIVPGDIQILGDHSPIVLMRDHQPTGGYPRIATVVSADLDRFAQMRPGSEVRFQPVTLEHAR
jgi:5-oxoprolinase (ATP-hydrolysing) subunit C